MNTHPHTQMKAQNGTYLPAITLGHKNKAVIVAALGTAIEVYGVKLKFMLPSEATEASSKVIGMMKRTGTPPKDPIVIVQIRKCGLPTVDNLESMCTEVETDFSNVTGRAIFCYPLERRAHDGAIIPGGYTGS